MVLLAIGSSLQGDKRRKEMKSRSPSAAFTLVLGLSVVLALLLSAFPPSYAQVPPSPVAASRPPAIGDRVELPSGVSSDWWATVREEIRQPQGSLTGLSPTADWMAEGDQAYAEFGFSVATAGDVNGDGYSDVIVGAPEYSGVGRAFVYHGSPTGLSTTADWTASDPTADEFGNSVATAGDVNNDGYDDVIVGAPNTSNPELSEGKVYVYHGSPTGLNTTPNWTAEGDQDNGLFGISVGTAGDVNNDGYDEIIVGAHYYSNPEGFEGAAFVWHGGSGGLGDPGTPGNADWMAESDQAWAIFGLSVGTAGNVNGDAYDDVIIGSYWYSNGQDLEGAAFVWHGGSGGLGANGNPTNADWTVEGDQASAWFGVSVGTAGDVNGDGYDDAIVGANQYDGEGRAFVYHGSPSGLTVGPADWMAESGQADARFGVSVGTAGDVNDDGYDDVIVGANWYNLGQPKEGRAYVYHGSATGLGPGPQWTAQGDQDEAYYGQSVGTAGDVNNDGFADVVVGAYLYDNDQVNEGRAYAYHGSTPPPPRTAILANLQRMGDTYGDITTLTTKLYELAAHPEVIGQLLQVEDDPNVAAAYADWDANPDDTHANAVCQAIKDHVLELALDADPTIEYVVIVGPDWIIPFFRAPDNTVLPPTLPPDPATFTDDYYTDRAPAPIGDHFLYIPDLPSGRLVEHPYHIIGQIDTFLDDAGVALEDAAAVGYDFVTDSAQDQCDVMGADGIITDCQLIGEHWDATDFITTVLDIRHDAVTLNQHANNDVLGTPDPTSLVFATAFVVSPDIHARALFWTPGCHSGQNLTGMLDLPEALGQKRATYIASTGYGFGLVGGLGYGETLMGNLARWLVAGTSTTPGQALMEAKQQYFAATPRPNAIDEKVVFESTLYGLPMYQVTSPGAMRAQRSPAWSALISPQIPPSPRGPSVSQAPQAITHTLQFTYTAVEGEAGTYYSLDGWSTVEDGEPVQPRFAYEVGPDGDPVHGVLFAGGAYTTATSFTPVLQQVLTITAEPPSASPTFTATDWVPTLFHTFNRLETEDSTWETLVATLGQYHAGRAEERLLLDAQFVALRSSTEDWEGPLLSAVSSWLQGDVAHVQLGVSDPVGVYAVLVVYSSDDGLWHTARLSPSGEGTWAGSFPAGPETEFYLQAADMAGNVALMDQDGTYFRPGGYVTRIYLPLVLRGSP
jgi:hypothetical protein